jgi:hypothetical protein
MLWKGTGVLEALEGELCMIEKKRVAKIWRQMIATYQVMSFHALCGYAFLCKLCRGYA